MPRLLRSIRNVLAGIGLLFVAVAALPIDEMWLGRTVGPWNDPKGDILIVLGAESMNDMMGPSSYWRAVYAVRVWRDGGFRQVVLSGGTSNGGAPIAEQMRDFLVCHGVPAAAILLEARSIDTHENAVFTTSLLASDGGRKVLLTSDTHMFRAYRAFRKAGMAVEPRPFPDAGKRIGRWTNRWGVFLDLCGEAGKTAYYRMRGWI